MLGADRAGVSRRKESPHGSAAESVVDSGRQLGACDRGSAAPTHANTRGETLFQGDEVRSPRVRGQRRRVQEPQPGRGEGGRVLTGEGGWTPRAPGTAAGPPSPAASCVSQASADAAAAGRVLGGASRRCTWTSPRDASRGHDRVPQGAASPARLGDRPRPARWGRGVHAGSGPSPTPGRPTRAQQSQARGRLPVDTGRVRHKHRLRSRLEKKSGVLGRMGAGLRPS